MLKRTALPRSLWLAFGSTAVFGGGLAQAQQTGVQELQRVEVTGSNIRRTQSETASPVQTITREDIERSGKATVGDYLQGLSVDGAGSIPSSFGNGFATGAQAVSLRGLGAGSTLVLLNGRRMAPYGLADDGQKVFTDLSTMPMEAVERIEILKDGASAVYGSDAIAGVVNIILRRDFRGMVAKASYGTSRYGDGDQKKATLTAGIGDLSTDRYNVFFNLEANKTDPILYRDRDRDWIGADVRPYGYAIGGPFNGVGGYITQDAATSSPTGNVRVGTSYVSLPGCSQYPAVLPADPRGGCLWNPGRFSNLLPSEETYNLFGRGTVQFGNDLEAYAEAGYVRKKSSFATTPSGVSGAWGYPGGPVNASSGPGAVVLAPAHPDNIAGGDRLRYSAWDVGPRVNHTTNEFTRVLAGLKGSLGPWDFDTGVLHSETSLTNERTGYLRYSVLKAALGDPTYSLYPYRIGPDASLNSAALYAALSPTIQADARSTTDIVDVKASRELAALPGGPLALALGAEYRHESSNLRPTTYTDIGDIVGLGYSAYEGKRNSYAAYAELLAPVAKTLELSAALRYDKYRDGPSATTPKVGLKWTPLPQLALRGTYAEGFRAPNAAESGKGGLAAFTNARDPVRCPGGNVAPGASAADCNASIALIVTPNPGLEPEKSKSYTIGFVLEPIAGTSVSIDAWQIRRSNEINQSTAAEAIAAGHVVRSDNNLAGIANSGTLLSANAAYVNSSNTTVKGVDLDLRSRWGLGEWGKLTLGSNWTHISSYRRVEADGTELQFAGTHGNCDTTNCIGTPKDRVNLSATWDRGAWQFGTSVNYIGPIANIDEASQSGCNNTFADGSDAPGGCRIASFTTVDLSGRWRYGKNLEVFGSIQNVFDRVAPLDPHTYGALNYNPLHVSGAVGRFFTIGLKYSFF